MLKSWWMRWRKFLPDMLAIVEIIARILIFLIGSYIIVEVVSAAIRTFVLPRSVFVALTGVVFRLTYALFRFRASKKASYEERDAIMALFAPIALLMQPVVWIVLIIIGYTLIFWATTTISLYDAFSLSGSSLLTLGFTKSEGVGSLIVEFSASVLGLTMVALLIAYLPTMYAAFSKRETLVTMLETRAGSPPSPVDMFIRVNDIRGLEAINAMWEPWEVWFAEVDETHTSLVALVFFRSPDPHRSWITAGGVMLDTASLMISAVDVEVSPNAQLMIRAGYIALRHIADYFSIDYDANPKSDDPISISKFEFHEALNQLAAAGVPLKADREQAWRDYSGWRVNYDRPLLALAALTMAPYAPWVSDRSLPHIFQVETPKAAGIASSLVRRVLRRKQALPQGNSDNRRKL